MTSATVRIWRDCGFTEGTLEVPSKTSSLPSYQYSFTLPAVPREDLFNSFRIKHAYEDLYDCNYLQVTYDMNNGDDVTVYGWIDAVRCISDTAGSPNTLIEWHTDLWRTFLSKATFGAGVVTKRPQSGTVPPQTYSNMTQLMSGDFASVIPSSDYFWVFLNLTATKGDNKVTTTYCWPVSNSKRNKTLSIKNSSGTVMGVAPSFNMSVMGYMDEALGLDPDAIYGAWLSPIPPRYCSYTTSDPYIYAKMEGWAVRTNTSDQTYAVYTYESTTTGTENIYAESSLICSGGTTDTQTCSLTDFDRNIVFSVPWGVTISKCRYRLVNADTSMYIAFRFSGLNVPEASSETDGMSCAVPLKSLAMSSNAKSAYVYSGQQEYDRQSMSIARDQALVSSVTSAMTGSANNAVMASLGESTSNSGTTPNSYRMDSRGRITAASSLRNAPNVTRTTSGIGIGPAAAVTMGVGVAGAAIDWMASGYFNDRTMDATMDYKAKQTSTLTLPGSGWDWVEYGIMPSLVTMKWDDYSVSQRASDIALYGISVREPMTSCQALINQGGPIRIQNLNVTGSIPPGAKHFFRERFAQGVRMI